MATRSGVRAPHRSGPVRSPYSGGNKMLTAMPGGVRLIPVAVRTARPAKGRTVTLSRDEYRYQPVPPEDGYERAAGRRYRRAVARSLGGGKRAYRPAQYTRSGIAQDYQNEQRRHLEHRARDVAILLGWR